MVQKLSATAIEKLAALREAKRKWERVHALVEQAATQAATREIFLRQCRRTARDVSHVLEKSGFRALADTAEQIEGVIKRPGSFHARLGALREVIGALYTQMDRAERAVHEADRKRSAE
jgi:hypothetical protein